ncbi:MAG TPA: hypothetical protein VFH70_09140 [Acidimicrobiales bacterium]|nr:hypothetical protein [Acidimicrobiales bacterium]
MSELEPRQGLVFDDIESELLCSDREATLGVFLGSDERSPQSMVDLARARPWEPAKPRRR